MLHAVPLVLGQTRLAGLCDWYWAAAYHGRFESIELSKENP